MRAAIALALLLVVGRGASVARADVAYAIRLERRSEHLVAVEATVADAPAPLYLSMPVWTPGAYERRDWGRNVGALTATEGEGRALTARRAGPDRFLVEGHRAGATVRVRYEVFANVLSDDASQLDGHHAHLLGTSILLRAHGREGAPHQIAIALPPGWRAACALEGDPGHGFRAASYEALVDAPIEAGGFAKGEVTVGGRLYQVVIDGAPRVPPRLLDDLARFARAEAELAGAPPFSRYLAILHLAPREARGTALEHAASTSMIVARGALDDERDYRDLVYALAHELFHAWSARRLRPVEIAAPDFDRPAPSRALWISEALSEYYAHRALRRAGLWSEKLLLARLAAEIDRVASDPSIASLSLEEEAELAWHAPDAAELDPDVWYPRGMLALWALDAAIRSATAGARSLDDVLRRLLDEATRQGGVLAVDTDRLAVAAAAVAGAPLADLLAAWARRPGLPSLGEALAPLGLVVEGGRPPGRDRGARLAPRPAASATTQRLRAAWLAGL